MVNYQEEATEIFGKFLKLKQTTSQVNDKPDFLAVINKERQIRNIKTLIEDESLNKVAHLIALDAISSDDLKPKITLDQALSVLNVRSGKALYVAITYSLPLVEDPKKIIYQTDTEKKLNDPLLTHVGSDVLESPKQKDTFIAVFILEQKATASKTTTKTIPKQSYYTGVELWAEIQKYRREKGVPELRQDNTLCTLTSIRVNQLLKLGDLDDHRGFQPLVDEYRKDGRLNFSNLGENILMGYPTPKEAVAGWDGSLGHQSLMKDGSYVWGCASANSGFAVLIAAY